MIKQRLEEEEEDTADAAEAKAQIEHLFSHLLELQKEMEKMKAEYEEEINQYNKLTAVAPTIASLTENDYQTLCHVGHGCHVQSIIPQAGKSVHIHVGLGFFVEVTWPEALEVAKQRTKILKNKILHTMNTIASLDADLQAVTSYQD